MNDQIIQLAEYCKNRNMRDNSILNLAGQIGPTLIGVKPASLINIPSTQCLDLCKACFSADHPVSFRAAKRNRCGWQAFIFHKNSLGRVLEDHEIRGFLRHLGYPADSMDSDVSWLIHKIRGSEFPHEIGVFLGYPLKDVYGFTGAIQLPYSKTLGWKMYGDTRSSESVYYSFQNARNQVRDILKRTLS